MGFQQDIKQLGRFRDEGDELHFMVLSGNFKGCFQYLLSLMGLDPGKDQVSEDSLTRHLMFDRYSQSFLGDGMRLLQSVNLDGRLRTFDEALRQFIRRSSAGGNLMHGNFGECGGANMFIRLRLLFFFSLEDFGVKTSKDAQAFDVSERADDTERLLNPYFGFFDVILPQQGLCIQGTSSRTNIRQVAGALEVWVCSHHLEQHDGLCRVPGVQLLCALQQMLREFFDGSSLPRWHSLTPKT